MKSGKIQLNLHKNFNFSSVKRWSLSLSRLLLIVTPVISGVFELSTFHRKHSEDYRHERMASSGDKQNTTALMHQFVPDTAQMKLYGSDRTLSVVIVPSFVLLPRIRCLNDFRSGSALIVHQVFRKSNIRG